MSLNAEKIFNNGLSLYKERQFDEAIESFTKIGSNLRAKINICIIYDTKRDCFKLKDKLPNPFKKKSADYKIWYYLGFLYHKINEFGKAIYSLDKCLEIEPNFIPALIKKGYSLEGTEPHRLEEAINCFQYILNLNTEDVKKELGEIYHGLGHFLAENNKTKEGIEFMKKAIIEDIGYLPCYGTLHSEAKKYSQTEAIFNDALTTEGLARIYGDSLNTNEIKRRLKIINEKKELKNEIIFYRGEAYCGLGNFKKAIEDFQTFSDYCKETDNKDGLAHAQLYIVKSFLKQANILLLKPKDFEDRLKTLEKYDFSLYANRYIHRDREKTIKILKALLKLSNFFTKDKIKVPEDVSVVTNSLSNVFNAEKLDVLFISDNSKTPPFKHDFINFHPFQKSKTVENNLEFKQSSLIFIHLRKSLSTDILNIIYKYLSNYSIFVLLENPNIDLTSIFGKKANDILIFSKVEEIKLALVLIGAYEKIKYDLLETVFLFGLTPTTEAPSFSAQTGVLPLLLFKNNSD